MKIDLKSLPPDGGSVVISGEDPASTLAWDYGARDVVRPSGPLHWDLRVRLVGTELLVDGTVEAEFSGTCCRCGGPLKRIYTADAEIELEVAPDAAEADLTSELRETILLALPNHPVCSDGCPGPALAAPEGDHGEALQSVADSGNPWGALDSLFGGTTQENPRPRNDKTPKPKHKK